MRKSGLTIFFLLLTSVFMSACAVVRKTPTATQSLPQQPSATEIPATATSEPTAVPLPQGELISVSNAAQMVKLAELPADAVYSLRWSLDGSAFWLANGNNAELYNARTLEKLAAFATSGTGQILDASPDGKTIAVTGDMKTIDFWDVLSHQKELSITPPAGFGSAEFSPDGQRFLTTATDAWEVTIWNTANGSIFDRLSGFETAAPMYLAKWGMDGDSILWIARGTLQPMDIPSKTIAGAIQHEDFIIDALVLPKREYILSAAAGTVNGKFTPLIRVSTWQGKTTKVVTQLVVEEPITALTAHPYNILLAAAHGGQISMWEEGKSEPVAVIDCGVPNVTAIAFAPNGRLLLAGTENGVQLWAVNPK